jgi:hypothetical protein
MWRFLHSPTGESLHNPNRTEEPTNPPRENSNSNSRSRIPAEDDATANPRPRNRQRPMEPPATPDRCCDCNVWGTCSAAHNANCSCRKAGRECTDCRARNCRNRRSEDEVSDKPGAGWTRPTPAPTANGRAVPPSDRRSQGTTNPPPTRPPTPNPTPEPTDTTQPPGVAPAGEADPPPDDTPAGDPPSDGIAAPNGSAEADATPIARNNTPIAEGVGGEEINPT